ncbi:MAG: hypothetical protein IPK17_18910 [Chloroflexi bacterium]|uniref:TolB family protein n=1 Tax=Candidatus Flexifilum breve TaxID=3140694 RepID=UPI003135FBC2|nr:hypothetical protein [Chloroflexota bacterium]
MSTRHLARLLSGLLLFALTTPLSAQSAEPFSELQVVERIAYDLELPRGNLMSFHLASDGQRILDASRDQICVYDLAGVELSCAERPDDVSFDPESVHWSPDGRFVALIDGLPLRTLRDSDLWVLDLETGEYRNLTDDNGRDNLLAAFGSDLGADTVYSTIDLQPRFTPDGTLYFMRYEALNQVVAALLYRLELPDGAPEAIAVFTENTDSQGFPYLWDIAPNGQTAVFSSVSNGNEVLRRVEIATGDISILHQVERSTEIGAIDLRFSPLGNAVLWHTQALALYGATATASTPISPRWKGKPSRRPPPRTPPSSLGRPTARTCFSPCAMKTPRNAPGSISPCPANPVRSSPHRRIPTPGSSRRTNRSASIGPRTTSSSQRRITGEP